MRLSGARDPDRNRCTATEPLGDRVRPFRSELVWDDSMTRPVSVRSYFVGITNKKSSHEKEEPQILYYLMGG
eukprot:4916661-Prymnesium_polylepis.1